LLGETDSDPAEDGADHT
jgi:hypothetical protein